MTKKHGKKPFFPSIQIGRIVPKTTQNIPGQNLAQVWLNLLHGSIKAGFAPEWLKYTIPCEQYAPTGMLHQPFIRDVRRSILLWESAPLLLNGGWFRVGREERETLRRRKRRWRFGICSNGSMAIQSLYGMLRHWNHRVPQDPILAMNHWGEYWIEMSVIEHQIITEQMQPREDRPAFQSDSLFQESVSQELWKLNQPIREWTKADCSVWFHPCVWRPREILCHRV